GTDNVLELQTRAQNGDNEALFYLSAMAYQISKEIGAMAAVLEGKVDAILITGGIAHSTLVVKEIKRRVEFIAPVEVYPGEDEMLGLALGALRVLKGEENPKEYK
ncbi:MAG: butyrate kinase, partial [bacterium]